MGCGKLRKDAGMLRYAPDLEFKNVGMRNAWIPMYITVPLPSNKCVDGL